LWPTDFCEASRRTLAVVNGLAEQFSVTVDGAGGAERRVIPPVGLDSGTVIERNPC
jgi:hypothetical protein